MPGSLVLPRRRSQIRERFTIGMGRNWLVNRIPVKEKGRGKVIGVITQILFRDIQELQELHEKVNVLQTKINSIGAEFRKYFQAKYSLEDIVGESEQTCQLKNLIIRHAPSSLPVLILGESGTGKELFAHAIHRLSPRSKRAFIVINCAAIPKELMGPSSLGDEPGAFTGASQKGRASESSSWLKEAPSSLTKSGICPWKCRLRSCGLSRKRR